MLNNLFCVVNIIEKEKKNYKATFVVCFSCKESEKYELTIFVYDAIFNQLCDAQS